jgi:hypothetical protein
MKPSNRAEAVVIDIGKKIVTFNCTGVLRDSRYRVRKGSSSGQRAGWGGIKPARFDGFYYR